ncbi:hypothetical protein [Kibdelosporangium philippinense]
MSGLASFSGRIAVARFGFQLGCSGSVSVFGVVAVVFLFQRFGGRRSSF